MRWLPPLPWFALVVLLLVIAACGGSPLDLALPTIPSVVPHASTPAPAGETAEAKLVRELRDQLAAERGQAMQTEQRLAAAERTNEQAKQEQRLAPIRAGVAWLTGLGLVAGAAGVVLVIAVRFWGLGVGSSTAWAIAVGGVAVAGFAQGFGEVLPYLARAFAVLFILAALAGIGWLIRRLIHSNLALGAQWRLYAGRLAQVAPDEMGEIDRYSHALQDDPGIKRILDRVLDRAPLHHLPATQPSDAAA
jgi:hypothetical protein